MHGRGGFGIGVKSWETPTKEQTKVGLIACFKRCKVDQSWLKNKCLENAAERQKADGLGLFTLFIDVSVGLEVK